MATTSTINHQQDIHHQNGVAVGTTLQLTQQMTCTSSPSMESDSAKSSLCSEATAEDLIFFHTQSNPIMDFLLEGDTGSSRESLANLLDEGLGTSLDGTEELCKSHPGLGRNDSGIFSTNEETMAGLSSGHQRIFTSSSSSPATPSCLTMTMQASQIDSSGSVLQSSNHVTHQQPQQKKVSSRPKNASSPSRQGPQRCLICGKTFSNASALTKHKLTHSDERKHTCTVCGKAFKRQDHLNGHMLTHRSKKPFECSAEGCGKSYCDARSLRRHVESRHGLEALASMTIAPTPHTDSDFSIIIPNHSTTNPKNSKSKKNHAANKNSINTKALKKSSNAPSTSTSSSSSSGPSSSSNPNPLLCQGSTSSPGDNAEDENELLTSVENFLSMDESSTSVDNTVVLLDSTLMEMDVIHESMEEDLDSVVGDGSVEDSTCILGSTTMDDKLNNNSLLKSGDICCVTSAGGENIYMANIGQSQLHQLLTQRALSKRKLSSGDSSGEELDFAAVTLIKESLIASCTNKDPTDLISTPSSEAIQLHIHPKSASSPSPLSWTSTHSTLTDSITEMGKSIRSVDSLGGIVLKCPTSPQLSSPHSLKEQLELIHQIIQQTTEESAAYPSSAGANLLSPGRTITTPNSTKPTIIYKNTLPPGNLFSTTNSTSSSSSSSSSSGNTEEIKGDNSTTTASSSGSYILGLPYEDGNGNCSPIKCEDKPVECAICCRRFKNTPALNGHMRLHGGYFKKETDGKKKESSSKESQGAPLQTASVSVRALIEEKIIQRRNTINNQLANAGSGDKSSASSSSSTTPKTSPPTSMPTTPTKKPASVVSTATAKPPPQVEVNEHKLVTDFSGTGQFPFDDVHAEYFLIEEEVFNKVSSICPDSLFTGIDESLLCESGIGTGSDSSQISTEFFNWTSGASSTTGVGSLFGDGTNSSVPMSTNSSSNDNPFTPLPTMDPVFFTPTPGSVHSHQSQSCEDLADSPSFIYPTPPASLESHNALQSPLFPFPFPFEASPQSSTAPHNMISSPNHQQLVMVAPTPTPSTGSKGGPTLHVNSGLVSSPFITSVASHSNPTKPISSSHFSNFLLTTANTLSSLDTDFEGSMKINGTPCSSALSLNPSHATAADGMGDLILPSIRQHYSSVDVKPIVPSPSQLASSASFPMSSTTATPAPYPSMTSNSYTMDARRQAQALLQMKSNEPCSITGDSAGDSFRNPNRIFTFNMNMNPTTNSLIAKVSKRKALRNTLASNLRPQTSQSPSHFTPYPILSPVRSAPGLFWTFSAKLAHVDEMRKDRPRINIGANFQATIPPLREKPCAFSYPVDMIYGEDQLWNSESMANCFGDDVEKYLEFACCSAIPGGGCNKEYALHILHLCKGDINAAMLLMMMPDPKLPVHLNQYKYADREKWTRLEILQFQESLLRHGKDFMEVSKELGTKSRAACVSFYQLWKKVCSDEYEKVRAMWKKREAAFTIELLKTIPPPVQSAQTLSQVSAKEIENDKQKQARASQQSASNSKGPNGLDEFPCKICGKIFSKVKSRSAHMKSHRPPPTPPSPSPAPVLSPASAATLIENKEKIADALQKHIFGKANAKSLQNSIITAPAGAPFMPKIVTLESLVSSNVAMATHAKTGLLNTLHSDALPPPRISSPATSSSPMTIPCLSTTPTAHRLELQAT